MNFQVIPVIRIFDEEKARAFYLDYLGMQLDWAHRFEAGLPVYMQVSRADMVLHLSEHAGDCSPGCKVIVNIDALDALHQEVCARDYKHNRPTISEAPWGSRVFEVTDPFANKILFNELT